MDAVTIMMFFFAVLFMGGMAFLAYYLYKNPPDFSSWGSVGKVPTNSPGPTVGPYDKRDRIFITKNPDNSNFIGKDGVKGITLKDHTLFAGDYKTYYNSKGKSFGIMVQGGNDSTEFKYHTGEIKEGATPHQAILTDTGELVMYDVQGFRIYTWSKDIPVNESDAYVLKLHTDGKLYIYKSDNTGTTVGEQLWVNAK